MGFTTKIVCFLICTFFSVISNTETTTSGLQFSGVQTPNLRFSETCEIFLKDFDKPENKKNLYWARESIGADLVDMERLAFKDTLHRIESHVCDSSERNHNYKVQSIADGESSVVDSLITICEKKGQVLNDIQIKKLHRSKEKPTQLINRSMIDTDGELWMTDRFLLEDTILVNAAGNDGFTTSLLPITLEKYGHSREIWVAGSQASIGLPSHFSGSGEGVFILAPSDFSNFTCPKNRARCSNFSGTSGAGPLVTHGIKAALETFPVLKKEHLQTLIEKTIIPVPSSYESPKTNGIGMMNSYKLWKVTRRIAAACERAPNKDNCIEALIATKELYQFPSVDYKSLFPRCYGRPEKQENSCEQRKKDLRALRTAAFLNPENRGLWRTLACVHSREGSTESALLYKNVGRDFTKEPFSFYEIKNYSAFQQVHWYNFLDREAQKTVFSKYRKHPRLEGSLWKFGKDIAPHLIASVKTRPSRPIQARIAVYNAKMMGAEGTPILQLALDHPSVSIRRYVVKSSHRFGKNALPYLQKALADESPIVVQEALESLFKIGPEIVPTLTNVLSHPDPRPSLDIIKFVEQSNNLQYQFFFLEAAGVKSNKAVLKFKQQLILDKETIKNEK